jgi:hypothetical protein
MEPSSLRIHHTKNGQKWTRGEKVMALESKGDCFYKNISIEQHTVYFQTPQTKFLHITMLLLELQDDV